MDLFIFQYIHSFANKLNFLDLLGVFLAEYLPYFLLLAVIIFLWREKSIKRKLNLFFTSILVVIISWGFFVDVIRFFYDRLRPFSVLGFVPLINESSSAFPSRHAAVLFAVAFIVFSFNKKFGYWFFSLSFLVSLARVFVGVHWPSDIVGGFIVAFLAFLIVRKLIPVSKDRAISSIEAGE